MRRRSGASAGRAKARRYKTVKAQRRKAPIAIQHGSSSTVLPASERDELLAQQTATAKVLQVISTPPVNFVPVFEAMLAEAVKVRNAHFGFIYLWDGNEMHFVAAHNVPDALADARSGFQSFRPDPNLPLGRMVATKAAVRRPNLRGKCQPYLYFAC